MRIAALFATVCAIAIAIAVGACGGSGASDNSSYPYGSPRDSVSVSKCMRANGVSGFPDPRSGPNGGVGFPGGLMIESRDEMVVMGQTFAGPALEHAEQVCKAYLPPAGGPPPSVVASQRAAALASAACMRHHGLPNFPDPTFNGGTQALNLGPGLNPNSPAFQRAAKACGLNGP